MLKPRQQGHALNWSSPCLLRDDISTGGSNQCDTLTETLRQIASSLPARSDLHFSDKTTHYYCLAFSVGPCFGTFVVTSVPLFPECSHVPHAEHNMRRHCNQFFCWRKFKSVLHPQLIIALCDCRTSVQSGDFRKKIKSLLFVSDRLAPYADRY